MASSPFQCISLSLLIIPPLILATYLFAAFPNPPQSWPVLPSLSSLPLTCHSWKIYPEDFYPGGAYVTFPQGRVRYWLLGPENGKKIVLIHGLSIPSIIWKDVAPELASRGFRVLLYDLYGRGYSDAPQTTYDTPLFTTQLALLMQHIKWDQAYIVGVSMGGGIAAAFAHQFPHLVSGKIALIASAGIIETSDLTKTAKFMSAPLVQTVTSSFPPFRKYLQHLANSSSGFPNPIQEIVRIQSAHLPGYNAAVASSLRDGPIRGLASAFSSTSLGSKKVLLIHGTADNTVHYKYAGRIQSLLSPISSGSSKLITVEGGGHDLTVSHPELVWGALVRFFTASEEMQA